MTDFGNRCTFVSIINGQCHKTLEIGVRMETRFNSEERKRIREGINEKYKRVAISPEGNFNYPTGRAGLEKQK